MGSIFSAADIETATRLFIAAFLGAVIGFEREIHGKEAGSRTHALVCLGSALMMVVSIEMFEVYHSIAQVDPGRIAAQVVSGIGFIGAGAIIRERQGIKGLTTAAGIWASAGIGLACGCAQYKPAILTTVLSLAILTVFSRVNRWLGGRDY